MENEAKRIVYHTWEEKLPILDSDEIYIEEFWSSLNDELVQLDKYLQDEGMDGIGYRDHTEEIEQLDWDYIRIGDYIVTTKRQIVDKLDHPLYKGFFYGATECLSRIKLENYTTENTLKIEVLDDTNSSYNMMEAPYITLENFLGICENYSYDENSIPEEMKEFTRLFEKQYDSIKEKLIDEDGNPISQEEYFEMLLTMGEFRGWKEEMLIQLGEALLEVFIIFPIIEMITGTEILTGDKLTKEERALKGVSVVISLLTLGQSCLTAKGAGLAFQEALVYAGKTLAIDAVAVGATHGVGLLCQELGVSVPLTIILSFAAGMTVSLIGTKYVLKDSLGNVQFEFEGGKGSKFQEVFDVADNYTLSDDTFNNHILDRHGPNSTYGNKSHFNTDFDIRDGIDSTLKGDNFVVGPNTAGREGYIFEQTFANPIGTNSKGKPLYTLKVVIDEAGNVITAFPKK